MSAGGSGGRTGARGRWRSVPALAATAVVLAGVAALAVLALRGEPAPRTRAQEAHRIAAQLRCPVCEDLSVADSPAPLAGQMRQQIAQQLAAGRSAGQIEQGFVASYGDSVLLRPPHRGIGLVAYVLPFLVAGLGIAVAAVLLRRWRRPGRAGAGGAGDPAEHERPVPKLSARDRRALDAALARLLEDER